MDAYIEIDQLRDKIYKLSFVIERYRNSLIGTRRHEAELMKEYHLTLMPSSNELRHKYIKLYYTVQYIEKDEEQLDGLETRMMLYRNRLSQLEASLGIRHVEPEVRHPGPQMKKFGR